MTKTVRLGRTDLYVNPIGLGTNAVGGKSIHVKDDAGRSIVQTAIENGVNFLDTAFIYGPEKSEIVIGEVLKDRGGRENIVLATKGAHKFVGEQVQVDNSPDFLKKSVEESLKRLQTDYIDLYYIHFPDKDTPKDEAVGALKEMKDKGMIRAIGVSNFSMEQLLEANKDGYIDVYQGGYNLIDRTAEKELLPYMRDHHISFVPYFPLASGLLTGKYDKNTVLTEAQLKRRQFQGQDYMNNLEKVEMLRKIADEKGAKISHVVLAWYLTRDTIDSVIPGAKRPDQVMENLKTLDTHLTEEEIQEIDRIFSE